MNGLSLTAVVLGSLVWLGLVWYIRQRVKKRREEPSYLDTMRTLSQKDRRNSR
jgi:hypothetical protein